MSTTMLYERTGTSAFASPGPGIGAAAFPQTTPGANWCVLPRCNVRVEKCKGGLKLWCSCDDEVAAGTLQNLCKMLADGLCSVCCTRSGITVCQCSLSCGICKCEFTKDGVCITCLSGDKTCCDLIQACCDCLSCCLESGCCCYVCFGGQPVCCGTC